MTTYGRIGSLENFIKIFPIIANSGNADPLKKIIKKFPFMATLGI